MKFLSIKSEIIVNEHERHFILAAASGVTLKLITAPAVPVSTVMIKMCAVT